MARYDGMLAAVPNADVLLGYDANIVRHWRAVTERRVHAGEPLHPEVERFNADVVKPDRLDPYTTE